ncbi:unnamed protein product [Victoria cruziana]
MADELPPHQPLVDQPPLLCKFLIPNEYDERTAAMGPEIRAEHYEINASVINMLPTFHGIENENPYRYIDEFFDVCTTVWLHGVDDDSLYLHFFLFSLKEKAKHWLKSLTSSVRIRSWEELQCAFLKKYFPIGKTNQFRRAITSFAAHEGEYFHWSWEQMKKLLCICPHHQVPK